MFIYGLCLAILAAPYPGQTHEYARMWIETDELNRHVRDMAIAAGLAKNHANWLMADLEGTEFCSPDR